MQIDISNKTIGELALEVPNAIGILEQWKIDYCCHGGRSVEEACSDAGLAVDELVRLMGAPRPGAAADKWAEATMTELQKYIVDTHHVFTREILETLRLLSEKVARRHGPGHPEVLRVKEIVTAMYDDLTPHMMKEERVLFPYIVDMETAVAAGKDIPPPFFGSVRNPIAMMMNEHEAVGELLVELRSVTREYTLPEDACLSFRALYERLIDIEQDLHKHIHLENNLLFPRAAALEATARPAAAAAVKSGHDQCGCGCSA